MCSCAGSLALRSIGFVRVFPFVEPPDGVLCHEVSCMLFSLRSCAGWRALRRGPGSVDNRRPGRCMQMPGAGRNNENRPAKGATRRARRVALTKYSFFHSIATRHGSCTVGRGFVPVWARPHTAALLFTLPADSGCLSRLRRRMPGGGFGAWSLVALPRLRLLLALLAALVCFSGNRFFFSAPGSQRPRPCERFNC